MSNSHGIPILATVDKIFSNIETPNQRKQISITKNKKINKKDLELALTVLLVELASCDEKFLPEEYHLIATGLKRIFGTTKEQVQTLVNQATQTLRNLRGTSQFGNLLKENLDEETKLAIMEIIDDVIHADGVVEGFELYFRHKIAGFLGMKLPLNPHVESN